MQSSFFAIIGIPRSAKKLHQLLLSAVVKYVHCISWLTNMLYANGIIRAPFHFFTSTDNGMTLNRFSQDMSLIDQALPFAFIATVASTLITALLT